MQQIQFIGLEPNTLLDLIDEKVNKRLEKFRKHFQPKEPPEYLTRNEVAEMLKINLSSVHNWTKKGILTSYQCGGKIYYKRAEVESQIIELKK
jgi:excisionase family DNA binding protein